MVSFWQWLTGEAGAGWIIGILTALISLLVWLRRERAPRITLQQIRSMSLLDVHPSQAAHLQVKYADAGQEPRKIESLHQTDLVIYNTGAKDIIDPIELVLTFQPAQPVANVGAECGIGLWKLIFDDATCRSEAIASEGVSERQAVRIVVPYLNSYRTHRHAVRTYLIAENPLELQLVRGSGPGWSSALCTLARYREVRTKAVRAIASLAMGLVVVASIWFTIGILRAPYYSALYNPTLNNLDRIINYFASIRQSMEANGMPSLWARILRNAELSSPFAGAASVWAFMLVASMYLSYNLTRIASRVTAIYLGVVPPEHWDRIHEARSAHSPPIY